MKKVIIPEFGISNLKIVEEDPPKPQKYEVLVKIYSVSLNYRDYLTIEGKYNPNYKLPLVPCSDGAGEIVEIGESVQEWKVGDRVIGVFAPDWVDGKAERREIRNTLGGPNDGTLTQYRIFHKNAIVSLPKNLSYSEAATLPCAGLTAWSSLFVEGNLKPGDTVLVQGTGGVSLAAISLAKSIGATVVATTGNEEKEERLKFLGVDHVINYNRTPNWGKVARSLGSGDGIDHILEVGGAGTLEESIKAIKPFGQISLIGILSGSAGKINLLPVLMQNVRLQGILVGSKNALKDLVTCIEKCEIHPVIDKEFPMESSIEAIEYLKSGSHFGKICIRNF